METYGVLFLFLYILLFRLHLLHNSVFQIVCTHIVVWLAMTDVRTDTGQEDVPQVIRCKSSHLITPIKFFISLLAKVQYVNVI